MTTPDHESIPVRALQDDLADCHYNIALLYEAAGQARAALRHLNAYRRLQSG